MQSMDYKEFYGEHNVMQCASSYAHALYEDNNSSRQIENLLYKVRKEIGRDEDAAPSLLKRNFDTYLHLKYSLQSERIRADEFRELRQDYSVFFDKCQRLEQENKKLKEEIETLQKK